ncbi:MAG TPA: hypothetical protein VKX31_06035 [Brumimicrobium sp.]|nr:hypothetical protein [Brumimicrobium sp.]
MRNQIIIMVLAFLFFSCSNNDGKSTSDEKEVGKEIVSPTNEDQNDLEASDVLGESKILQKAEADVFSQMGFDDKVYYELLIETRICDPTFDAETNHQTTPCSSKLFNFFPYNHKRKIEDAFLLQVKAGVNNYPYRRLLIFVRERGQLVMMNGITGYLVKRIPQENEIDDLIVAVIDDIGNNMFDRYDVLLRYKDGKYHFVEAIGDLQGTFDDPELKANATKAIHERIIEKELIF